MFLICLEVVSSFRCLVVYLEAEGGLEGGGMDGWMYGWMPLSLLPQGVQQALHAAGRLILQNLDAALHLKTQHVSLEPAEPLLDQEVLIGSVSDFKCCWSIH